MTSATGYPVRVSQSGSVAFEDRPWAPDGSGVLDQIYGTNAYRKSAERL